MSHFIISSKPTFIFGTPNGHASTQLLQAMQRGLRAVCTTPSPVRLMASAGQTSAQVGESQCMQTTGTVCTEIGRSTYCRWIIEWPRCVSHSLHACTHAWQPMQRFGSTKNSMCSGTPIGYAPFLTRTAQPYDFLGTYVDDLPQVLDIDGSNHADLFWACRGGTGGTFGINTSLTFNLVEAPQQDIGWYRFDYMGADDAMAVHAAFDALIQTAPAALNAVAVHLSGDGAAPADVVAPELTEPPSPA